MNSGTQELHLRGARRDASGACRGELPREAANINAAITTEDERCNQLLRTRFVLSAHLTLECVEHAHVRVANRSTSERFQLSHSLYRFLCLFEAPRSIAQVATVAASARLMQTVCKVVEKGILVNADASTAMEAPRTRRAVAHKFCNSPSYAATAAVLDFVVLGVPYDLGGAGDCRSSPTTIRQKSLDYTYELQFATARPRGWLDVDRGRRILEGAFIADAGDVYVRYGESQRDLSQRIGGVLDELGAGSAAVPLILGGDRSVTCAVVDHRCRREPLTVVQLAMTEPTAQGSTEDAVAAHEIRTRLLSARNVRKLVCFGPDDRMICAAADAQRLISKDVAAVRGVSANEIVRQLALDSKVHVSIDLSGPSAQHAKPNPAAVRGGFTFRELKDLIGALGESHCISSIDVVGLDRRSEWHAVSSVVACQLALAAMSAAYDPT